MYRITDDCIACSLCERACPVGAIYESSPIPLGIGQACDECPGEESPRCIHVCPVECIVLASTVPEMLAGLADDNPALRLTFAKVSTLGVLTASVVERGLTDPVDEIRAAFSSRSDFTPVAFQIERGLTDSCSRVRFAFALRSEIALTQSQIGRGLLDESSEVRAAVSGRKEFAFTPEQIERGLTDQSISVRCNIINQAVSLLTEAQLERARKDSSAGVQMALYHHMAKFRKAMPRPVVSPIAVARLKHGRPGRQDGGQLLKQTSHKLESEINAANSRLQSYLTPRDVLFGLRMAAEHRSCVLLQPGHSGSAWSDRTIPAILIVSLGDRLRVRVRRAKSYRNTKVSPAVWPLLRGFPRGDIEAKLSAWSDEPDGDDISRAVALSLPLGDLTCNCQEWSLA